MKKTFKNTGALTCIFSDEGISLYGKKSEAFYPYGCMDAISVSFLGNMEIRYGFNEVSFRAEKEDWTAFRQTVKEAKELIKKADPAEAKVYVKCSKVTDTLPPEEQLKEYKHLVATGTISKGYYDLKKRLLLEEMGK